MKLERQTLEALKGLKAYFEALILWLSLFTALYFGVKWLWVYDPMLTRVAGAALGVAGVSTWFSRKGKVAPANQAE